MKILNLSIVIIGLSVLAGCGGPGCPERAPDINDGIEGVLSRNPAMYFQDSSGAEMLLELFEIRIDTDYVAVNDCTYEYYEFREYWVFEYEDKLGSDFELVLRDGRLTLQNVSFYMHDLEFDSLITINGQDYPDIQLFPNYPSDDYVLISDTYGPIVFHSLGNYHWERVIQ